MARRMGRNDRLDACIRGFAVINWRSPVRRMGTCLASLARWNALYCLGLRGAESSIELPLRRLAASFPPLRVSQSPCSCRAALVCAESSISRPLMRVGTVCAAATLNAMMLRHVRVDAAQVRKPMLLSQSRMRDYATLRIPPRQRRSTHTVVLHVGF